MRILLDENLDWRLSRHLPGHEVKSVALIGWTGIRNGELLVRVAGRFDVLVTMDSALVHDHAQRIKSLPLAVIALRAPSNRLAATVALMPRLLRLLPNIQPGTVT